MADSRSGRVLSEGASGGFRWGAIGALVGALAIPVGIGALAMTFGAGLGLAAIAGIVTGVLISPVVAGTAILGGAIGGGLGTAGGFNRAGREANEQAIAAAYNMSKEQTFQGMGQQLMAEMQAAQSAPNPYHQASSTIDAASARREATRVNETAMEAAR
jgi:hypothetical protein